MASTVLGNPPYSASSLRSSTSASRSSMSTTKNARNRAGSNCKIELWFLSPPFPDYVKVRGGILKAVCRRRPLVLRPARKHRHPFLSERHSGANHGVISPRDYIIYVVCWQRVCRRRFLLRQLALCRRTDPDTVDSFTGHLGLCRVEFDLFSRPAVSVIVATSINTGIPIRHVERQGLLRSAEIKNNFGLFFSVRAFQRLERRALDRGGDWSALQVCAFKILRRKHIIFFHF